MNEELNEEIAAPAAPRARSGAASVLLVDDEADLVRVLKKSFEAKGLRVFCAHDAESGLALARRHAPNLVILDVMLPGVDGMEFCRLLRRETQIPILFLTAKNAEMDKVLGLKLGGDDYLTKPFHMEELLARVEALLRRSAPKPAREARAVKRLGQLEIDVDRHELRVRGRAVDLTPKEFDLLKLLVEADGKVLSRGDLAQRLWGADGSAIGKRTVDQHVARLRRKLGTERRRILTVTNSGYRVRYD